MGAFKTLDLKKLIADYVTDKINSVYTSDVILQILRKRKFLIFNKSRLQLAGAKKYSAAFYK